MDGVFGINWSHLLAAIGLFLIIEAITPLAHPPSYRSISKKLCELSDSTLRIMGFVAVAIGVAILVFAP